MTRVNLWKPEAKRRAGIVRPPVVPGLPLSRYSNKELAVRIVRRSNAPRQDPGIAWARLMISSNRPEKDAAREAVLRLMTKERFPDLSILTFPASDWRFETALLKMREDPTRLWRGGPDVTRIQSLERDEAVYRAGVHNIPKPDKKRGKASRIRVWEAPSFATACVHTVRIDRFFRCTFEEFAAAEYAPEQLYSLHVFDAAWLDFNGNLSQSRLDAIERFWNRQVRSLLVVTLLNGRMGDWVMGRIRHHGSIEHLLSARLAGSVIEDSTHYGDGAPMVQITLRRDSGSPTGEADVAARILEHDSQKAQLLCGGAR